MSRVCVRRDEGMSRLAIENVLEVATDGDEAAASSGALSKERRVKRIVIAFAALSSGKSK